MKRELDLSGVDPVRVPEIRRRVAILDEYVALKRPTAETRRTYADRLELSVSQLYYLARVWRLSRDAASIPGARSRFAEPRQRRIDVRALNTAREVIAELGPTTMRKTVLDEVALRCAKADVDPPSNSTVTNMLSAARSDLPDTAGLAPEILVDEVTIKLPVADGTTVIMPRVLVAVALPERRIVAAEIGCTVDAPPSATALMHALSAQATFGGASMSVRAPHLDDPDLAIVGPKARRGRADETQLGQVLGNRLGDLGLLYRARRARPASRLAGARHASVLTVTDARRTIEAAIAQHNASLAAVPDVACTEGKTTRG